MHQTRGVVVALALVTASCGHGQWRTAGSGFSCFGSSVECYATQATCQAEYDIGLKVNEHDTSLPQCTPHPVAYCFDFEYTHPVDAERNGQTAAGVRHKCQPTMDDCQTWYETMSEKGDRVITKCVELR